jgi:hypothetical protein
MIKALVAGTSIALLTACGGGGGGGGVTAPSSITLQGVAATGAAISGGTVDVKCKNGTGTATTNTDGTYTVTVAEGAQPCILRAVDPITKVELYSIVEAGGTTANITPVTSLVVANTLGVSPATSFATFNATTQDKITATNISTSVTRIQAATAAIGTDADMTGVDIMKGSLTAATDLTGGDANDKKIDALMAALTASDKKITDLTEQLKTATTNNAAAAGISTVVGDAKYSLANCPYARNGDVWVLNFAGGAPVSYNADFNSMVLKKLSNNTTSAIDFKRDGSNNAIPCAFTSTIGGVLTEFRVSEGGIGAWTQATDFGLVVPVQKTKLLTDASMAGTYPAMAFIREKTLGFRGATPIRYEIDANGDLKGYSCDMTKAKPECLTTVSSSSADPTTCVAQSNGTLACTSTGGLAATAILYVTGSQVTIFMSLTNMNVGTYRYGGLLVMTKAAKMSLPKVGATSSADSAWYTGVNPSSNIVVSGGTSASTVETVDTANNTYTTSSAGSTTTYTRYVDTPANGLLFSKSTGTQGVTMSTSSGLSIAMLKGSGTEFDGWATYVRAKR